MPKLITYPENPTIILSVLLSLMILYTAPWQSSQPDSQKLYSTSYYYETFANLTLVQKSATYGPGAKPSLLPFL